MFRSVSLLRQAPLARGSRALPSVLFLVFFWVKKKEEIERREEVGLGLEQNNHRPRHENKKTENHEKQRLKKIEVR